MTSPMASSRDLYLGPALFSQLPCESWKKEGPDSPPFANTPCGHTATLPAVAVALGSMVHEDASSGLPGPLVGHVDHGAGDKVVPRERRTERKRTSSTKLCGQLRRVSASTSKGALGHQAPVSTGLQGALPSWPHGRLDGRARGTHRTWARLTYGWPSRHGGVPGMH